MSSSMIATIYLIALVVFFIILVVLTIAWIAAKSRNSEDLYDEYERIPENSRRFIEAIYVQEDMKAFYKQCREMELENKDVLVEFQDAYPGVLNGDNLADILRAAKAKKERGT